MKGSENMEESKVKKMLSYRWIVWGVLALAYIIVFFHRLAIGVVREDLVNTFGITGTTFANIGSTYFYAYMFMQIPSGILADSLGARKTVTLGTLLAGIGSIMFGLAPNLFMVFAGRLLVGIGVSVVFIAILKVQSQWFKESEFGTMSGITSFIGNMGGIFAQTPLAILVGYFTWRSTFAGIGAISILLAILCYVVVRNTPQDMGLPTIEEIEGKKRETQTVERPPVFKSLVQALTNPYTWPGFIIFAGFFGAAGLIALYIGLAKGKMSIVAPLAAVISVITPVIYSALNEGVPSILKITGFTFAFIGIWFIVSMNAGPGLKAKDMEYPLLAGVLFGLFFISIDRFSATAIYWPLTASRITALIMLTGFMMLTKTLSKPTSDVIPVVLLAGLFNTGGATLFALASEAGRLDVATVLSSLSTAVTVVLACTLFRSLSFSIE